MSQKNSARVLVVDFSSVFREAVLECLRLGGYAVVGEAQAVDDALPLLKSLEPNLAMVGATFTEDASLGVCRALHHASPTLKLILFTEHSAEPLFQVDACAAGVDALLRRRVGHEECWAVIDKVMAGQLLFPREIIAAAFQPIALTGRERQVLQLWAERKSNRDIAGILSISLDTARTHAKHILRKLQVNSRAEALRRARRRGFI
jgi:DNA-binding NarL/FixJ family response regulator